MTSTHCEYCIFKLDSKDCTLGRLKKFKDKGLAIQQSNGSYIIDCLCNTCRNVYWDKINNCENLVKEVYKEVEIKYDAIIGIDGATLEEVTKTVKTVQGLDIQTNRIGLFGNLNEPNLELISHFPTLNCSLDISTDIFGQTQKYVNQTDAKYLLFLIAGLDFSLSIKRLDKLLNEDLTPKVYEVGQSYFLVSKFLYLLNIYETNPFITIQTKYDEFGKPKSQCTNSQL